MLNTTSIFYLIWHTKTWQDFANLYSGKSLANQMQDHLAFILGLPEPIWMPSSRRVPSRNHLLKTSSFHHETTHSTMFYLFQLVSARQASIRHRYPLESTFALKVVNSLPPRRWFSSSSRKLTPFILSEVKFVLLILSHMAFLLSPFARGSISGAFRWSTYFYNTSWHYGSGASRSPISIAPRSLKPVDRSL